MKKSLVSSVAVLFVSSAVLAQTPPTLQSVTNNGNETNNRIILNAVGGLLALKGDEGRYVHWINSANTEVAWMGFGTTGSNAFGIRNAIGPTIMFSSILDIWNRTMVNNAVDDNTSALIVNGNVRLSNRGQNYIVKDYATFGETMSGAATIIGNNAKANNTDIQRIDNSTATTDGSNAMVMSYIHGTMFHVKASGAYRAANTQWFTVGDGTDEVMRLTPSQNVLIGTATDDPAYKLQVKGNVKAQKVKVTAQGWADFVFEPEYRLPSLFEVEQFILQHRHLPEIPSAKEVEENGVDLGEMNKKLLQKVEEQTLYIIEINKRLKALEEKVGR
ncbi:hypothetical protein [Chitinophaga niabensis]|uniref:Chaperone of endosialidase n=1 Tax=Chitinophaga niabensis TaxID=536979 RepID=A0A1N6EKN3_9BACT|nr:hypothetical protein [Chitinophaga niabensis]SIN83639.1 hypothetical protein SAMN04488055_1683 [Chitinophaga niabensis]